VVSAGGTINGATISGATMEIASGGLTGTNPITYVGNAALILDASTSFSGTVAGFALGDYLDLKDISFNSGTTSATFTEAVSNISGTLSVTDGIHTANITLLGQYANGQFHLNSDGFGGTVVTDPPLAVANSDSLPLIQSGKGAASHVARIALLAQYLAADFYTRDQTIGGIVAVAASTYKDLPQETFLTRPVT
jgi:hypothetical protein